MASIGWVKSYKNQGQDLEDFPNLKRWFERSWRGRRSSARLSVGQERRSNLAEDKEAQKVLFGQRARA